MRARAYRPDLVLLVMVADDEHRSSDDAVPEERTPSRWEYLSSIAYIMKSTLLRPSRPDFSQSMVELANLTELVKADGAELALIIFTNGMSPYWGELWSSASAAADTLGVPILDLRDPLASRGPFEDLRVHPIDGHPNQVAHRIAAKEIVQWAERESLIPSPSSPVGGTGRPEGS